MPVAQLLLHSSSTLWCSVLATPDSGDLIQPVESIPDHIHRPVLVTTKDFGTYFMSTDKVSYIPIPHKKRGFFYIQRRTASVGE